MDKIELKIGDLLQLKPEHCDVIFAQCIFIVEEVTPEGCVVFVQEIGRRDMPGPQLSRNVKYGQFEVVGHAKWYDTLDKIVTEVYQ